MSGQADATPAEPLRRMMRGRDLGGHRASTPLELLFDLTFVVAVPVAIALLTLAVLHRATRTGAVGHALLVAAGALVVPALGFSAPALGIGGAVLGMGLAVAATPAANLFTVHRPPSSREELRCDWT
ncbi:hypothetical protein [Streptomyces daliensis]